MANKHFKKLSIFLLATLLCAISLAPVTTLSKSTMKLSKKKLTLYVGKTYRLKVKNTKKKITWKSSRKKVASVTRKGVVRAKNAGTARISAKVGKKKMACLLTVKKKAAKKKTDSSSSSSQNKVVEQTATPSPSPKKTSTPLPTENPATRDDGWLPGWY